MAELVKMVCCRFPVWMVTALRSAAREKKWSVGQMARDRVERYLEEHHQ